MNVTVYVVRVVLSNPGINAVHGFLVQVQQSVNKRCHETVSVVKLILIDNIVYANVVPRGSVPASSYYAQVHEQHEYHRLY